ncbi:hypothetical protein L6164_018819 [Bauhinia variegata]|uniref:Uncharacterized protein n=1 Tax=Bauhinia variegata TaxID=167791 RepID=A0ACB9NH82_BAUVA|nr:hypothetical protein L6164_018819 [Bauhinia variegata]
MLEAGKGDYANHGHQQLPETSQAELTLPRVLLVLSSMLEKLVARNEKLMDGLNQQLDRLSCGSVRFGKSLDTFHGVRAPSISIPKYLERIYKLLVTSIMVASKMLDDAHYNNAFYARVGGVSNAEMNRLELELLFLLDFGVTVSSRVFESYCLHLEKEMLCDGTGLKIERALVSATATVEDDHETQILVDDNLSSFPPQIVD